MSIRTSDDVTVDTIQRLVEMQVFEDRSLDFKSGPIGQSDDDKKELLKDVSALANTQGGHLVIGVVESSGVAVNAPGIKLPDPDKVISRIENILRDGLQPRLPSVRVLWLPLDTGRGFLVIAVPRSWAAPHRVTFRGHDRFYARNSNGVYALDVHELKAAFLSNEGVPNAIRKFRKDRISGIINGDTPILLRRGPTYVCHILPLSAFVQMQEVALGLGKLPGPIHGSGHSGRHTIEGFVTYSGEFDRQGLPNRNYSHTYRNGRVESVFCEQEDILPNPQIDPNYIEKIIIEELEARFSWLELSGIEGPFYIFLTVLWAKGLRFFRESHYVQLPAIVGHHLQFPELVVEHLPIKVDIALRPLFDQFANAFGRDSSWSYGEDGHWKSSN